MGTNLSVPFRVVVTGTGWRWKVFSGPGAVPAASRPAQPAPASRSVYVPPPAELARDVFGLPGGGFDGKLGLRSQRIERELHAQMDAQFVALEAGISRLGSLLEEYCRIMEDREIEVPEAIKDHIFSENEPALRKAFCWIMNKLRRDISGTHFLRTDDESVRDILRQSFMTMIHDVVLIDMFLQAHQPPIRLSPKQALALLSGVSKANRAIPDEELDDMTGDALHEQFQRNVRDVARAVLGS